MALNSCKMWSNGVKTAFFSKMTKNCPAAGGFAPRPPQWICFELQYTFLLNTAPNLDIPTVLTIGLSFPLWTSSWLHANARPRLLIFHSTISLPPQKIPRTRFLMTSLHVICGLGPPPQSKILATPSGRILENFGWGGIWSQSLKNSDVFTKVESGFSAEIGTSNVFFAQNQVVSKKKKKKKKVFTKVESDFSAENGSSNVFFAQNQVVSKKKKKRSSPKLRLILRPDSLRLGRWEGMHPELEPNYSK